MNQTDAITRLDEIEQLDPDPTFDVGALEIMEMLAERPEGLRLLVERYSSSPSANIAGCLALVLGKKSTQGTPETAPLVFEFAAKLKRNDHDGALMSSLNAMQNQIGFGAGWGDTLGAPSSLFPFLKHCLNFSGKRRVLVHFAAIELLTTICWGHLLTTVFSELEIQWILKRIDELGNTDEVLVVDAITELRTCLNDGPPAVQGNE
jgi:hypothetical protein